MQTLRRTLRALAAALAVALLALAFVPRPAHARDYSIDKVDIDATIGTDGSLTVTEVRTFDFDGAFNGVYWDIAKGEYEGRQIEVDVLGAGQMVDGSVEFFEESSSERNNTYSTYDYGDYLELKIFSAHEDETVQFVIKYELSDLVGRYEDVAELYWKFVSDGWQVESQNVTCTVHLPVPEGETVEPEKNVRAWGHGPLDASVNFEGDDVVYTVPGVGTGEFAEARITFPEHWVPEAKKQSKSVLDDVLSEEMAWADEANELRERARENRNRLNVATTAAAGVAGLGTVGVFAFMIKKRKDYKATHTPAFDDDYYRDVPTGDHPAVLATLANDATMPDEAFTAALMRLTDQGIIKLDKGTFVKKRLLLGDKSYEDYFITFNRTDMVIEDSAGAVARQANAIDRKALKFLVWLASHDNDADDNVLQFSSIKTTAKKHAESYKDRYDKFKETVEKAYNTRFASTEPTGAGAVGLVGGLAICLGIALIIFTLDQGIDNIVALVCGGALAFAGLVSVISAFGYDKINPEGIEVRAKLEALKRWFKDFTRLKEAVPHDVILWNRLLVMAVALGVSEEVIKQLEIEAPEVLSDPDMRGYYYWYYMGGPMGSPASVFATAMQEAHSVSEAQLAKSDYSSGGGGGGGFSGGGGGGFGGGGGGGAF